MDELDLLRQLRALRTDAPPPRDLWPSLAQRLPPRRSRRRLLPLALAATLLAALPALLLLMQGSPAAPDAAPGLAREADAMALHYRGALAELAPVPLPSDLRDLAEQLDREAETLRAALDADPQSLALLHQLRRVYDHRLHLSQRAALG